ncbi:MAG: hypothetical protein JWM40_1089, partial [Frankiales bacterium]|nr:hypothetical protein [Frankiales bacterium]
EQRIDQSGVVTAGALRRADPLRVVAQQLEVDHPLRLSTACKALQVRRSCWSHSPAAAKSVSLTPGFVVGATWSARG